MGYKERKLTNLETCAVKARIEDKTYGQMMAEIYAQSMWKDGKAKDKVFHRKEQEDDEDIH